MCEVKVASPRQSARLVIVVALVETQMLRLTLCWPERLIGMISIVARISL